MTMSETDLQRVQHGLLRQPDGCAPQLRERAVGEKFVDEV